MNCPKCQTPMLAEGVGEGRTKYTCPKEGHSEVRDIKGRQLLTDTVGSVAEPRRPLMG